MVHWPSLLHAFSTSAMTKIPRHGILLQTVDGGGELIVMICPTTDVAPTVTACDRGRP